MKTRDIPKSDWPGFFDVFSLQHEGWFVTLEISGAEFGAQIEERELKFEGIVAEANRAGGNQIVIMFGADRDDHISHSIARPTHVNLVQTDEGADAELAVKSEDGILALLRFRSPMLPEMVDGIVEQRPQPHP